MEALPTEAEVLARLTAWATDRPAIRAIILTSSRARPGGPVDLLSDYDIILAVTEVERFVREEAWLTEFGEPMARWGDESTRCDLTTYFRSIIYTDGVKIDFTLWPDVLLERVAEQPALPEELDEGYRVLLDKDGRTAAWKPPTHQAYIPAKPTAAEYQAIVEEFWWTATYVAKSLWRDELVFARWVLDEDIKNGELRRLLEWRLEIDHAWSIRPGVNGRGLKRLLSPDIWAELASTYVGPEIEANWAALFRTTALFRRVAREVADALGFIYPQQMDDQVSAHLDAIRQL
jgi:aminoglycoside 6-adenylyltransferase